MRCREIAVTLQLLRSSQPNSSAASGQGSFKSSILVMGNPNASTIVLSSESSEQSESRAENLNPSELPPNQQALTCPHGPVAILWDIENRPVPTDVRPEDVAGHIRMALQIHPTIKGAVTMFSAYGDFNAFPRRLREGCQRTGVKLIDVPNGRTDAADKAILVDMFLFALDNPPPSSIMLISGDVDFAPALHILGQRGYNVILVIPSGKGVSSALCNAGRFVWDWPSVACGEGFVPSGGDAPQYFMLPHMGDNQDGQNEGESILYRGISQNCHNSRDFSIACQALSEYNSSSTFPCLPPTSRSHSLPFDLDEVSSRPISSVDLNESTPCVQPGDLNGLKGQLVKLLEMSGGCLPIARVPSEYHRIFGRPLYVSVYGSRKLVNLFQKMSDSMAVEGKGQRKFVYLRNVRAGPSAPPLINAVGRRGKSNQEENVDIVTAGGSSDELSEDERAIREEIEESGGAEIEDQSLEQFKHELQEILVSYSCQIFIGCFEAVYEQRYKKPLNYGRFGVVGLEELFVKVRDVVVLHEEAVSKRKFPAAVGV